MHERSTAPAPLDPHAVAFYQQALRCLHAAGLPYLVGGAYALAQYTDIERHTKDFDVLVQPADCQQALAALAALGWQTEVTFPHWLAKAFHGDYFVDLIFRSANGVAEVDASWFDNAVDAEVFGVATRLCAPEELIWCKAFVLERERYDGADIAHLLRSRGRELDWPRLLARFGPHGLVLLSHLVLYRFIYPGDAERVPESVLQELLGRLAPAQIAPPGSARICYGTLLSRAQYLPDVERFGYQDARIVPVGNLTPSQLAAWYQAAQADPD